MIAFTLAIKTTNPNNSSQGFSRNATFAKARRRKVQREAMFYAMRCEVLSAPRMEFPLTVTVTRVAPSAGLDPHDGLGASLKGCIDGIADGLGLKNDRDSRVTWVLAQRRGPAGFYAVDVAIVAREAATELATRPGAA